MTGPAKGPQQAQPGGPTPTDRTYVYQSFRQAEASGTWAADAACPVDSPVPYTLTAKAQTLLAEVGVPVAYLRQPGPGSVRDQGSPGPKSDPGPHGSIGRPLACP